MTNFNFNTRLLPEVLRSIDSSTFTGSYQAIGTVLANPSRLVKFTNVSTKSVSISWDGSNDHEILPAGSFVLLDIATNKEEMSSCYIAAGTQFYVKGAAGTGLVYLSTYYAV